MNDVVIPYKQSFSDELRYTLRSLKNIPHGDVYVIGDKTRYKVNHIPYRQSSNVAKNTLDIINMAVDNPDISDDFIFIHDDTYIMKPIVKIGTYHRGSYLQIINHYARLGRLNYYTRRMENTYNKLSTMGIKNPLCYELHIPFVINKTKWRKVSEHITSDVNKLSMYGNLNQIGGYKIKDVKVRSKDWIPPGYFISTHDSSFNVNKAGQHVRETFSEKCEYER